MYQIICLNPINSLSELQTHSIILGLRLFGPFLGIILKICCAFLFPLLFIGSLLNFVNVFSLVMNSYFSLTSLNKYSHMLLSFFCSLLLRFFFLHKQPVLLWSHWPGDKNPHKSDSSDFPSDFQGHTSPLSHRSCKGFFSPFCCSCLCDPELYRQQQG